jgi:hypothetical protein
MFEIMIENPDQPEIRALLGMSDADAQNHAKMRG